MVFLKDLLLAAAIALFVVAAAVPLYDLYLAFDYRRKLARGADNLVAPALPRWPVSAKLAALALLPLLLGVSIVVVPSGMGGVRVSQVSGARPGTLYPGVHLVVPFIDSVALYDTRDKVYQTVSAPEMPKRSTAGPTPEPREVLGVQAREGLSIGLAVDVRYHLDPQRLYTIHNTLPPDIDGEVVRPVVMASFRDVAPTYTVREIFATKRDEARQRAADLIVRKLSADGIVAKEVMLRDVQLPPEYAKGLEGLLLKEQESDRMGVETDIQAKQVKITELQAEGEKQAQVKHAEADAQVRVLQAKAEADAMTYTLPLKQKQIEQTRLEAEARKESTIKNAEALAEAKVIDSKAELQRRNLLADAEANRIRVTAAADAERLRSEAAILNKSPLLINKIVAERLSDKVQIMMVPTDGKFFFTNDVLQGFRPTPNGAPSQPQPPDDDPPAASGGR